MFFSEVIPFSLTIDTVVIASTCLWSLALYLGLASARFWVIDKLTSWLNFAERYLYFSVEEFDRTRASRESQNAFSASILSIIPFLASGVFCNWAVELGLGKNWTISLGILACMACGIYDLGRRNNKEKS